jgi:ABC-type proline/glycine betaine transport system substrate-binding protein
MNTPTKMLMAATAFGTLVLTGCNPQAPSMNKTAKLAYVNWAEGVAYTHLAQAVLEEKMGYEVKLTAADAGPAYTAVAQGSHDAFMNAGAGCIRIMSIGSAANWSVWAMCTKARRSVLRFQRM